MQRVVVCCSVGCAFEIVLQSVAVCCSVLQCVAVYCRVLPSVVECCSVKCGALRYCDSINAGRLSESAGIDMCVYVYIYIYIYIQMDR